MSKLRSRNSRYKHFVSKLLIFILVLAVPAANATSLQYFGNGDNDIDRVKIRIDDPSNNNPGPPADVGAGDFTIEFWLKATADNSAGAISCGFNYSWINGNVVVDRDRFNQGRTFGVSLGAGRVAFAIQNGSFESRTICGSTDLRDGAWHHVAVQRRRSDGFMWLYVDGALEASGDGPDGDVSYPDNGVPTNDCSGPCTGSDPFLVIGAEKHDAGPQFPSFFGWVDELRLSDSLRYSANFTPVQQAFVADAQTAALYHFDEGSGDVISDSAFGSQSPGQRSFGGSPAGPIWSVDTPFSGGGSAGTLQLSSATYSIGEAGGSQVVSVLRVGGSSGAVSVDYTTTDGTAVSGSDYQAVSGTLTWADGDATAKNFSIAIIDDGSVESSETVSVDISSPTGGATLGNPSSATLTITDNDTVNPGSIQLSAAAYSVAEDGGAATIAVNRSGGSDGLVSVDYAVSDGTAVSGSDYQAVSGTLTWADGDATAKNFSIPIIDDGSVESSETVSVDISSPMGGATLGNPSSATLTIADNDSVNPGSIQLSAAAYFVAEDGGAATITVNRSGGSDGLVSVDFAVSDGTAVAGSDYEVTMGTLTWPDSDTTARTFTVSITDDFSIEGDETINISLSNVTGGATLASPSTAVLTISDNDVPSPGSVQFSSATYSVGEGAGAALTITLTRSGGSDGPATADYATSDGSATAGADYESSSGTASWADGDAGDKGFSITINDDSQLEGDETVNVSLQNVIGAAVGSPQNAILTIVDDEMAAPGTAQFAAAAYSVGESDGTISISVTRVGGTDGAVSVAYSSQGVSAVAGTDFQSVNGVSAWADGDGSQKTIVVTINDDARDEINETLTLSLSNPAGGLQLGTPDKATITIVDDDVSPPPIGGGGGGGGAAGIFLLLGILGGIAIRTTQRSAASGW